MDAVELKEACVCEGVQMAPTATEEQRANIFICWDLASTVDCTAQAVICQPCNYNAHEWKTIIMNTLAVQHGLRTFLKFFSYFVCYKPGFHTNLVQILTKF